MPDVSERVINLPDGSEVRVAPAFAGAEGSYTDWVYLQMLEHEWKRPLTSNDRLLDIAEADRPSARTALVVLFWSYFETRIERLLREALRDLPNAVSTDLLTRYSTVGSRLDRLYKIVSTHSYWSHLEQLGFPQVADLLKEIQQRRNQFTHGNPASIDDQLVERLATGLREEHESWVAAYNDMIAMRRRR